VPFIKVLEEEKQQVCWETEGDDKTRRRSTTLSIMKTGILKGLLFKFTVVGGTVVVCSTVGGCVGTTVGVCAVWVWWFQIIGT